MLIYLLKSGACLAIFMAFYTFFLEKENMHMFKRYYLLGALIVAFGIPLVTFTHYIEVAPMPIVNTPVASFVYYTEEIPLTQETNYLPIILWSIYSIGAFFFGIKFLMNLAQIISKINHNPKRKYKHMVHVLLSDLIAPHTFFKYIFLNKQKFEQHEIPQEVFWHEEAHAKQKHSIDVLFIELLQVIFWFHPLIYFVKHSIKMNHEFLADQAVLNRGISASNYQHIVLAFSSNAAETPLANAINYSSTRHAIGVIKKRFTVMNTHTSKRNIWLKSILLLPLLALTLYGFSEKKEVMKSLSNQTLSSDTIQDILIYIDESDALTLNGSPVKFENLESEINKLNSHLTKAQKFLFLDATIKYATINDKDFIKKIETILLKCDVFSHRSGPISNLKNSESGNPISNNVYAGKTIAEATNLHENQTFALSPLDGLLSPWEEGINLSGVPNDIAKSITTEMFEEYNTIAKNINSQTEGKRTAKKKDLNRLTHIYYYMSKEQRRLAEPFPNYGHLQALESIQQEQIYMVLLNYKGKYLVNDKLGDLKGIENDFKAIAADKNKSKTIVFRYDIDAPQSTIDQVMDLVKKYQLKIVEWKPEKHSSNGKSQIKATPAEMIEYNKLAKQINSQSPEKTVIRMNDMRRLRELHDKMTKEQRVTAEPIPNFPPPPPPPTKDGTRHAAFVNKTTSPPPPPIPPTASEEQKRVYEKAMNDYKVQRESYTYKYTNDKGEVVDVTVIPENDGIVPPPPPPISPAPPKALETNSNKKVVLLEHWYITINNKKYYYPYKKGDLKKYYDKYGTEVALDIVKEYKNKNDVFEKLKNEGEHYVHKSEKDKKEIDHLYSDLGGMYFRMDKTTKAKLNRPVSPILPYIKLTKNTGEVYYKKKSELTEEDKNSLPSPPPPPTKKN